MKAARAVSPFLRPHFGCFARRPGHHISQAHIVLKDAVVAAGIKSWAKAGIIEQAPERIVPASIVVTRDA